MCGALQAAQAFAAGRRESPEAPHGVESRQAHAPRASLPPHLLPITSPCPTPSFRAFNCHSTAATLLPQHAMPCNVSPVPHSCTRHPPPGPQTNNGRPVCSSTGLLGEADAGLRRLMLGPVLHSSHAQRERASRQAHAGDPAAAAAPLPCCSPFHWRYACMKRCRSPSITPLTSEVSCRSGVGSERRHEVGSWESKRACRQGPRPRVAPQHAQQHPGRAGAAQRTPAAPRYARIPKLPGGRTLPVRRSLAIL